MVFYTLFLQFHLKKSTKKIILRKKTEEKQNSATIMLSVDGKGTVFPMKLNYMGNRLNKDIKKENFKKRFNEFNWDELPD